MFNDTFFYAVTDSARRPELSQLLEDIGCVHWKTRPLPSDRPGLVLDFEGLRLFTPDVKPQYWHPGMAHLRLRRKHDPLLTALDCQRGERVLDCTMGLGHDTMVMSNAGLQVTALEQCAPLTVFTNQGIHEYRPSLMKRIQMRCTDFKHALMIAQTDQYDAVYLDPMFDKNAHTLKGFAWSMMRKLGLSGERFSHADIRHAYRVARTTVVLKLSPLEKPPMIEGLPPPSLEGSRRVKFARWKVQ
ncbi:MAG: class I SAM-dependent methyltransferase [Bradymonadia bacterium]